MASEPTNASDRFQRVYNLTPLQYGLSNIALRRLKVARFNQLNDPFELLAIDVVDVRLRAGVNGRRKAIAEKEGLVCFSQSWRNPLLWSHYADSHRGVALGFDVPRELLVPVRYIQGMPKVKFLDEKTKQATIDSTLDQLRYTKFSDWRYEDEVRQFFRLDTLTSESNLHFVQFSNDLVLREVILGPRCEVPLESIGRLVEGFPGRVYVTRARIAYSKFGVTKAETYRPAPVSKVQVSQSLAGGGIASLLPGARPDPAA